ncbi:DUF3558 domain-containing protein [Streptomyces sp. NPDC088789]|uniref:DUF3558 domain-containing protein n=1 Tax=Streptomyces sp. NPDC088789 TaxID=3365899 RepID=UPI00381178E4
MQRKAFVPGVATLLAAVLAGCTGGSGDGDTSDDSNPGTTGAATAAAEPGRYRTLPEPCGAVGQETLDSLLPGIRELPDERGREEAYEGEATLTYDTDRKVGCRWKVESATATHHLLVDLERVVSYDPAVSDDAQAQELYAAKEQAADIPEPTDTTDTPSNGSPSPATDPSGADTPEDSESSGSTGGSTEDSADGSSDGSPDSPADGTSPSTDPTPAPLPRTLDDLGDVAFVDDALSGSGSTSEQRTVTVAFRTSNVIVTIEYEEQSATVGATPDSKEMQDKARKLASRLANSLSG